MKFKSMIYLQLKFKVSSNWKKKNQPWIRVAMYNTNN
jgi:GTPase Era involved in 16S rRNA processing